MIGFRLRHRPTRLTRPRRTSLGCLALPERLGPTVLVGPTSTFGLLAGPLPAHAAPALPAPVSVPLASRSPADFQAPGLALRVKSAPFLGSTPDTPGAGALPSSAWIGDLFIPIGDTPQPDFGPSGPRSMPASPDARDRVEAGRFTLAKEADAPAPVSLGVAALLPVYVAVLPAKADAVAPKPTSTAEAVPVRLVTPAPVIQPTGPAAIPDSSSDGLSETVDPAPEAPVEPGAFNPPPGVPDPIPQVNEPTTESAGPKTTVTPTSASGPLPTVRATASLDLGPASASGGAVLRIVRSTASEAELPCSVTVRGFARAEVMAREQVAVIPRSASGIVIATDLPAKTFEVLTASVSAAVPYRAGPALTLFPVPALECTEAALFQAYRLGPSSEAFSALVQRYRTAVLQTSHRILGNWSDAEDVAQFVFLMLAQSDLRVARSLAAWLQRVARNAAIALLRSRNRRQFHEGRAAAEDRESMVPPEPTDDLYRAIDLLPPALGEAVRLRYLEGLTQNEAAARIGCPRGTVSQRATNGLRRLRGLLSPPVARGDHV